MAVRAEIVRTDGAETRERILDVAIDLFIEQGYDKTSLREIAEPLGISKAALYYHFRSKQDILLALHLKVHVLFEQALGEVGGFDAGPAAWPVLFDHLLDAMLANRKIFVMHERNQAAFESLHGEAHEELHLDFEAEFRRVLADPAVSLRDKVRLSCAQGALLGGLVLSGGAFAEISTDELAGELRATLRDVFAPAQPPRSPAGRAAKPPRR